MKAPAHGVRANLLAMVLLSWSIDGWAASLPYLVRDIADESPLASSSPSHLGVLESTVYFRIESPAGRQLWRTDGTRGGTVKVKEAAPERFVSFADRLFFFDRPDDLHAKLWRSDGTAEGTFVVKEFDNDGQSPLAFAGGLAFFANHAATAELWRSDGTADGTFPIFDLGDIPVPYIFGEADGILYAGNGTALVRSDGTAEGSRAVRDLGRTISEIRGVGERVFIAVGECSIFGGPVGELWVSDGTADGTKKVFGERCPGTGMVALDGVLYFLTQGLEDLDTQWSLWRSDGTVDGTRIVRTLPAAQAYGLIPTAHGLIFFAASPDAVWASDGSTDGTRVVESFDTPDTTVNVTAAVASRGRVYFASGKRTGEDSPTVFTLEVSDGTRNGTRQIGPLPSHPVATGFGPFVTDASQTHVFFAGTTEETGQELWAYQLEVTDCAGDCGGDGHVGAKDFIAGIRLALGQSSECEAYGAGPVTVERLVAAAAARFLGCEQ